MIPAWRIMLRGSAGPSRPVPAGDQNNGSEYRCPRPPASTTRRLTCRCNRPLPSRRAARPGAAGRGRWRSGRRGRVAQMGIRLLQNVAAGIDRHRAVGAARLDHGRHQPPGAAHRPFPGRHAGLHADLFGIGIAGGETAIVRAGALLVIAPGPRPVLPVDGVIEREDDRLGAGAVVPVGATGDEHPRGQRQGREGEERGKGGTVRQEPWHCSSSRGDTLREYSTCRRVEGRNRRRSKPRCPLTGKRPGAKSGA